MPRTLCAGGALQTVVLHKGTSRDGQACAAIGCVSNEEFPPEE
jgi:hypothetical protein